MDSALPTPQNLLNRKGGEDKPFQTTRGFPKKGGVWERKPWPLADLFCVEKQIGLEAKLCVW